ncbi:MAG: leucyl/phenylalanyl-tRNA--protein transferase [Planctomycetota bacterium]|nr:MAG: leucyl/phenylalanyl-tRNA--protein transferase [Planctomycetota bacterium]
MIIDRSGHVIDPATVLAAYAHGCFPMAEHRHGRLAWYRPEERAIITWDRLKCPRSLRKVMAKKPFKIVFDHDFSAVVSACAQRPDTWISEDIQTLYEQLYALGDAHCVAAYDHHGSLVGGCYGLSVGAIFCGESMFHRAPDAAKACVWELLQHLRARGFLALDCQQQSEHMRRFGAYEIDHDTYAALLAQALDQGQLPIF